MTTTIQPATPTAAQLAAPLGRALAAADERLLDHLADDIVLRPSGTSAWSGRFEGKDLVIEYLIEIGLAFPDTTTEIVDTLVSETRIAYLLELRIERDNHTVQDQPTWTMTIGPEGKVVDWELNDGDQYAMDEFLNRFPEVPSSRQV